jgi:hypothetical protein
MHRCSEWHRHGTYQDFPERPYSEEYFAMRPLDDDFDEFDFADNSAVSRLMREQLREERRFGRRRHFGRKYDDDYSDIDDFDDFDDEDYADYDEDEFDSYSGIHPDR